MNAWHYQILCSGALDMQWGFKDQTCRKIGVSKLSSKTDGEWYTKAPGSQIFITILKHSSELDSFLTALWFMGHVTSCNHRHWGWEAPPTPVSWCTAIVNKSHKSLYHYVLLGVMHRWFTKITSGLFIANVTLVSNMWSSAVLSGLLLRLRKISYLWNYETSPLGTVQFY